MKRIQPDLSTALFSSAVATMDNPGKLVSLLRKRNYSIISIPEEVQLYIANPFNAMALGYGNWVKEAMIYVPGESPRFLRKSPILENVRECVNLNKSGREFCGVNNSDFTRFIKESFSFNDCYDGSGGLSIETKSLSDNPFICFLLGEVLAREYALLLEDNGRTSMQIHFLSDIAVKTKKFPFVRQVYFGGFHSCPKSPLPEGPCIDASSGFIRACVPHIDRVRGIRYLSCS